MVRYLATRGVEHSADEPESSALAAARGPYNSDILPWKNLHVNASQQLPFRSVVAVVEHNIPDDVTDYSTECDDDMKGRRVSDHSINMQCKAKQMMRVLIPEFEFRRSISRR